MRFVVDGMLGKLARWLRTLGHYVDYDSSLNYNSLLDLAEKKKSVLLTRDEELSRRAKARRIPGIFITGDREEVRLAEVAKEYGVSLVIDMSLTKCPECGGSLAETSKVELGSQVPTASLNLYDKFWKCTNASCGKIYWKGGHLKQIELTLANARKLLEVS